MLKRATCLSCSAELALRPKPFRLGWPPAEFACEACGHPIVTTFPYRVGWMEALLFRIGVLPCSILAWFLIPTGVFRFGAPILGMLISFVLSKVLAFPTQIAVDKLR